MEKNEYYKLEVVCKNGDFKGIIDIPKGQTLEETECPNCKCRKLRKKLQVMRFKI